MYSASIAAEQLLGHVLLPFSYKTRLSIIHPRGKPNNIAYDPYNDTPVRWITDDAVADFEIIVDVNPVGDHEDQMTGTVEQQFGLCRTFNV